jgi:hypothetical protein
MPLEIIAVYSENHRKPMNSLQNVELLIVNGDGTYSYHWTWGLTQLLTKYFQLFPFSYIKPNI